MICPACSQACRPDSCEACGWTKPTLRAFTPLQQPVPLETPEDREYRHFRLALFHRATRKPLERIKATYGQAPWWPCIRDARQTAEASILQVTANGIALWLALPGIEAWASRLIVGPCHHEPAAHTLLACLLAEHAAYRSRTEAG